MEGFLTQLERCYMIESYDDFRESSDEKLITNCRVCRSAFSQFNTFTPTGWSMTQTDSICEKCFEQDRQEKLYQGTVLNG